MRVNPGLEVGTPSAFIFAAKETQARLGLFETSLCFSRRAFFFFLCFLTSGRNPLTLAVKVGIFSRKSRRRILFAGSIVKAPHSTGTGKSLPASLNPGAEGSLNESFFSRLLQWQWALGTV